MMVKVIIEALRNVGGFEVVERTESEYQLRLAGRLMRGHSIDKWLMVIRQLLSACLDSDWKVDISKHYILKSNRVFYSWRLIFQSSQVELQGHYPSINQTIVTTPTPAVRELDEIALPGASSRRNEPVGLGRGAAAFGKAKTGVVLHKG